MSEASQPGYPDTLEQSLELQKVKEDTFTNLHRPWTWQDSTVVPGGLLISACAAAAYMTVTDTFTLDNLQSQFLSKTDPDLPITYTVTRLSTGKRFAVRLVIATQQSTKPVICVTICFASHPAVDNHPAMTYTTSRETSTTIPTITLDDLAAAKSPHGPFMKFQRFPIHPSQSLSSPDNPQTLTTSFAAHIHPPLSHPPGHPSHILGLLNLSDYHVLDTPMALSNLPFGLFAINDHSRTPRPMQAKMYTSLNHSVYIHRHDGWRADELCYIEGRSSWAGNGRALVETRMFDGEGVLIASCVQEAFYILNDDVRVESKL